MEYKDYTFTLFDEQDAVMKGANIMDCKHEKIMSRDCELYCMQCGVKLPDDWLTGEQPAGAQKPAEMAKKPAATKKTAGKAK